jgi:hypothetical protein
MAATSYCRGLGVHCLQYIDDRFIAEIADHVNSLRCEVGLGSRRALRALFVVCEVLTRLGYTLGLSKCHFIPSQVLLFLGLFTNSQLMAFLLPEQKKLKFSVLRDQILSSKQVDVRTLQRFTGKCVSFILVVLVCIPESAMLLLVRV